MVRTISTADPSPDLPGPVNIGSGEMVTINQLVDIVAGIAGKRLTRRHDLTKPQGVRGRNSDNARLRAVLGWEPATTLEEGLARTIAWYRDHPRALGLLL